MDRSREFRFGPRRGHLCLVVAVVIACAGCSVRQATIEAPPAPTPTPLLATPQQTAAAQAAIDVAERKIALARKAVPGFIGADLLIARANAALEFGAAQRARRLADQAGNRAQSLITSEYLRRAKLYRARAAQYTGLGAAQLGVLRSADVALLRSGDPLEARRAYRMLKAFDQATQQAAELYAVKPGDTLQSIAADSDVYGNAMLWPLIYEANLDLITDPSSLEPGWELTIRKHPKLQAVYRAIERARGEGEVNVGPIRQSR